MSAAVGKQYISLPPKLTAEFLRDERRRAVRVVRRELEKYQRRRDMLGGAMLACSNILAALQKGRI